MKRLILHILFAIVLTGNDVWADTCSDLGYTQTSVSSCAGEYLVCPDDTSKIYCIERNSAFTNIVPNWTSSSTLISTSSSAGTSKFPSGNGWICYKQTSYSEGYGTNKYGSINGITMFNHGGRGGSWEDYNYVFAPVCSSDSILSYWGNVTYFPAGQ